jgi:polyferredoxin
MLNLISDILFITILSALVAIGILAILIWIRNLTIKMSILRLFIQIVAAVAIFTALLAWPISFSPTLAGVTALIANRLTLILILIFLLTAVFGRFFCGWLCPFAFYMDLLTRLRRALRIDYWKLPDKLNDALDITRYVIIGFILLMVLTIGYLSPDLWRFFIMFMGPFKPLIMIFLLPFESVIASLGEVLGFSSWGASFTLLGSTINWFNSPLIISLTWFVFITFTAGAFVVRLLWCRFCPAGITLSILNHLPHFNWLPLLQINKVEEKCTKCGICKRVCPVQVNDVYDDKGGNVTSSKCLACFRCVEMCPYSDCLKITFMGKIIYKSKNWLEPSFE